MLLSEIPHLVEPASCDYLQAKEVALSFCSKPIRQAYQDIEHISHQFVDTDEDESSVPTNEAMIKIQITAHVPNHEEVIERVAAYTAALMFAGHDGANAPLYEFPLMLNLNNPHLPEESVYA